MGNDQAARPIARRSIRQVAEQVIALPADAPIPPALVARLEQALVWVNPTVKRDEGI